MLNPISKRMTYLWWAAARSLSVRDRTCPACGASDTVLLRRKWFVTSLWECESCSLRFRVPKDDEKINQSFYQQAYSQGFTTDCPSDDVLKILVAKNFAGTEKDFSRYINILRGLGLREGDALLDFGSSWGYGSWQLRQAGFKVYSYEISKPRADFAQQKLACHVIYSLDEIPEKVRCMFSAHVIEHLSDPTLIWTVAKRVLSKEGFVACFCPNGEPAREAILGDKTYHELWGKVHPQLITAKFLENHSRKNQFVPFIYTSPYDLDLIAHLANPTEITGDELCLLAQQRVEAN